MRAWGRTFESAAFVGGPWYFSVACSQRRRGNVPTGPGKEPCSLSNESPTERTMIPLYSRCQYAHLAQRQVETGEGD